MYLVANTLNVFFNYNPPKFIHFATNSPTQIVMSTTNDIQLCSFIYLNSGEIHFGPSTFFLNLRQVGEEDGNHPPNILFLGNMVGFLNFLTFTNLIFQKSKCIWISMNVWKLLKN